MKTVPVSACIFYKDIITKGCVGLSVFLSYMSTENCLKQAMIVAAQSHWSWYEFSIEGG